MPKRTIKFLADENCDFTVVRSLRASGYDVLAAAEDLPAATDRQVIRRALNEERIVVTEDKDFGEWVFAHKEETPGVILIRYPAKARAMLGRAVETLVAKQGSDLLNSFTILEPGRARIRKQ